uniref:Cortexin 1 n=1 Tax=Paramormyrops kingsleyae TaxID=1676925 RepID=A0A3B3R6Y4_9TELE
MFGFNIGRDQISPEPPPPVMVGTEQNATLALVGLLLLLLALLLVRCFRVLLDPYSSMPASSWSDHKEVLERGQFEYTLV